MNSLELRTVLDTFKEVNGISNWRGIGIYFSGTYYTVINGKIPYQFAKFMLKKYSNYRHIIRAHGNTGDKIYPAKDELGNLYVDCYHIDSKECLIYFLSEYDYYYKQVVYTEKLRKKLYRKQRKIIAKVNEKLLENGNPYITTEQWLEERCMEESGAFEYTKEILKYVKEFDLVINPFSGKYNMKDPIEYVDDVTLSIFYDYTNSFKMCITNADENIQVEHRRDERGVDDYITFTLYYNVDKDMIMEVHHYIDANKKQNVVCLYRFNKNHFLDEKNRIDLRYDLLSNQAYPTYGEKSKITFEEKELLVTELKKAIAQAKKFTIKHMTKK